MGLHGVLAFGLWADVLLFLFEALLSEFVLASARDTPVMNDAR